MILELEVFLSGWNGYLGRNLLKKKKEAVRNGSLCCITKLKPDYEKTTIIISYEYFQ